jgi:hypothetical protein
MRIAMAIALIIVTFVSGLTIGQDNHKHDLNYCIDRIEEDRWAVVELSCTECGYIEMVNMDLWIDLYK